MEIDKLPPEQKNQCLNCGAFYSTYCAQYNFVCHCGFTNPPVKRALAEQNKIDNLYVKRLEEQNHQLMETISRMAWLSSDISKPITVCALCHEKLFKDRTS